MKDRRRKTLFFVLAVAFVLCFGAAGVVYAKPFSIEPYISITIPDRLDLDSIMQPGNHVFTPTFATHIAANVPYHIKVSLAACMRNGGAIAIPGS